MESLENQVKPPMCIDYAEVDLTPVTYRVKSVLKWSRNLSFVRRQVHPALDSKLHGVTVMVEMLFAAAELDSVGWAINSSALDAAVVGVHRLLGGTTIIEANDPKREMFELLHNNEVIDLVIVPNASFESLAEIVFHHLDTYINESEHASIKIHEVALTAYNGLMVKVVRK